MGKGEDDVGGIIQPAFVVSAARSYDVGGHNHHLLDISGPDGIIYWSFQKVYPPCAENVVREDEVLLWE